MAEKDDIFNYEPLWGKWYIDLPLGKGSFGTVYKITREEMGSKYNSAVKIITVPSEEQYKEAKASFGDDEDTLNGYFEDIVKNIVNEINMLYSLGGNTNIIGYQDHEVIKKNDTTGWDILIRMELVTSLPNYLETHQMNREQVIRLGIDICTALELCSKKGIIHRDIKDENIFISEDGVFKLGDFGIAKELSKSGRAASMRGTPLYMAPEVFKGEKYDAAVDIYSLGIVMYKLLNYGRMPFMPPYPQQIKYKDGEDALEKRISGEPLPLPLNAGEALGQVVLKACAYKPESRYASATEMKQTLEQALTAMNRSDREEVVTPAKSKRVVEKAEEKGAEPQDLSEAGRTVSIFEAAGTFSNVLSETQDIKEEEVRPTNESTIGIFNSSAQEQSSHHQAPISNQPYTPIEKNNRINGSRRKKWPGPFIVIGILILICTIVLIVRGERNNNASNFLLETSAEDSTAEIPVATPAPLPDYMLADENGSGNNVNGNFAIMYDNYIIFIDQIDQNIYISNIDGSNTKLVYRTKRLASSGICVSDGWIYHIDGQTIIKTRVDGSESITLLDNINTDEGYFFELVLSGNRLYYSTNYFDAQNNPADNLFYININGTEPTRVKDVSTYNFTISGNWLFYNETISGDIYRTDLDGNNKKFICATYAAYINVLNDWIYFKEYGDNEGLYKVKIDGTGKEKITGGNICNINIIGDIIYFIDNEPCGRLYKIDKNGNNKIQLSNNELIGRINIAGNWLFYVVCKKENEHDFSEDGFYKMRLDGSKNQIIQ